MPATIENRSPEKKAWLSVIYTMAKDIQPSLLDKLDPKQNLTSAQTHFLKQISEYYSRVAAVWYSNQENHELPWELLSQENEQKPLISLKNNGKDLPKWEKERLIVSSEYWSSLWKLVNLAETELLEGYQQHFQGEAKIYALFNSLIIQRAWNQFKICLSPKAKVQKASEINYAKLAAKTMTIVADNQTLDELKPHEKSELKSYQDLKADKNPYLTYVVKTCSKLLLSKNKALNQAWKQFCLAASQEHTLIIRGLKRTHSSENYPVTYAHNWENGELSFPYLD